MAKSHPASTPPLTPKQQRFVQEYLQDHNGTQAAIRAGQQKVAKKAEVTVDSLMAELEQARKLALKEKQASAAVTATMGKGKLAGLLVDKHKHSGAIGNYDLSKLSDNELDRLEQILGPLADDGGDPGGAGEEGG